MFYPYEQTHHRVQPPSTYTRAAMLPETVSSASTPQTANPPTIKKDKIRKIKVSIIKPKPTVTPTNRLATVKQNSLQVPKTVGYLHTPPQRRPAYSPPSMPCSVFQRKATAPAPVPSPVKNRKPMDLSANTLMKQLEFKPSSALKRKLHQDAAAPALTPHKISKTATFTQVRQTPSPTISSSSPREDELEIDPKLADILSAPTEGDHDWENTDCSSSVNSSHSSDEKDANMLERALEEKDDTDPVLTKKELSDRWDSTVDLLTQLADNIQSTDSKAVDYPDLMKLVDIVSLMVDLTTKVNLS